MSKASRVLKVQKGNTVYTCDLYTTTAEAAVYGASSYLPVNVGGTTLYAPLYPLNWNQQYYDDFSTPVHVEKNGTEHILAIHSLIRLGITAVDNETITVTAGGKSWTSGNKYFPYGTKWTAKVVGDTGWNAGALSPGASGTLTNANVTVTAGAATHKTYVLTLAATTNQTITLYYKNHNGSALATSWTKKTSTSSAQKFTLGHGSQWYATISPASGYTAGTITNPGTASKPNTLTAAHTVSATAATVKDWTVKIQITNLVGTLYPSGIAGTVEYNQSGTTKTLQIKAETTYTIYVRNNTKLTWTYNGYNVQTVDDHDDIIYERRGVFYINKSGTRLHSMNHEQSWTGAAITANTTFQCDDDS